MLIHELSQQTGLSIHTIRFYEKSGLIRAKRPEHITSNKYGHYDEDDVERLLLAKDAKSVGFTISEISHLMDAWYNDQLDTTQKISVLHDKLNFIEQKIKDLKAMKKNLNAFIRQVYNQEC